MMDDVLRTAFLAAAAAWVCDGYSLDIRYIAIINSEGPRIWDALVTLAPLKAERDLSLRLVTSNVLVGQVQYDGQERSDLMRVLHRAAAGTLDLPDGELLLRSDRPLYFESEMTNRDRWYAELHLQVFGDPIQPPNPAMLAEIDHALRMSNPPFDGLSDVANWLELSAPGASPRSTSITVRVRPPVDIILDGSTLADNCLRLTLHAHPAFEVSRAQLAVRAVPGVGLSSRRQASSAVKWGGVVEGRREGTAEIQLEQADAALTMLMVGNSTVRRNWFLDASKARNNRLLAVQHFDKDLRMVRQAVVESTDSTRFELGVAALLFLLGFSPAVQLETDAPDLVVTTPGGKLCLVECTTRIADFASKLGKLVDRRGSVTKVLQASGHVTQVSAVLVCKMPRDQIAAHERELRALNAILVTSDDLTAALERVRFPTDPDRLVAAALARLASTGE